MKKPRRQAYRPPAVLGFGRSVEHVLVVNLGDIAVTERDHVIEEEQKLETAALFLIQALVILFAVLEFRQCLEIFNELQNREREDADWW